MNRTQGKELDFNGVFRVSSNGTGLELLIKDLTGPNGIAFSPDEKKLYVADSMEKFINVYDVDDDGYPVNGRQFADLDNGEEGVPDGMKIDTEGRIYSTMVRDKNYGLGHGIGRSGDVNALQPKAIGSSLVVQLSRSMTINLMQKTLGLSCIKDALILPFATGMSITISLLTLKSESDAKRQEGEPAREYVIFPRID